MSVATAPSSLTSSSSTSTPSVAPPAPLPGSNPTVPAAKPRSLVVEFLLGGCATMTAALFTNPIEVVKTRMQVQGELVRIGKAQQLYTNPFQAFYLIGKEEGLRGLQSGLGPAVLYQLMMNGTRLGAYEPLKRLYTSNGEHKEMWRSVAAGSTSGVLSAVMGSPFFLIKVRLQVQSGLTQKLQQQAAVATSSLPAPPGGPTVLSGSTLASSATKVLPVGHQHSYTGAWQGMYQVFREEGVRGLYRGATAAMLRVGVGSGVQLSTYDASKRFVVSISEGKLTEKSIMTHFTASLVSGVFITLAMNPFDVMSTRLYNQPVKDGKGLLYSNVFDCAKKIVTQEGPLGFYKGFLPHYLRLGPHTILTFVFWEQLKQAATKFGI